MANKVRFTVVLVAIMAIGAIFASSAFAGPSGTCGGEVSTGLQLYNNWKHEGVVQEAVDKVLKPAGYHSVDGPVKPWMEEHVFKAQLAQTTTIHDWGCENGHMFKAGTRTLPKGEWVMGVFPTLSKSETLHKPHKGYKRTVAPMHVVGKVTCSNPFNKKTTGFVYKKVVKHHPKHHKCGCHHKKHKPKVICHQGQVGIGNGCSPQTNNQKEECEVHSGSWNENTLVCVQVGQNGVCSAQSGVVNGNNNTVNQEVKCGNNTETCVVNSCNVTVEEKPCGCTEAPKIMITGKTELNMIPAGKTSGAFYINVNASESGGTLTVDPGIGGVSSCSSSTSEDSFTTSVPSGASKQCVVLYAPEDGDKPASMTVTMTANLGSASDQKTETFKLTYPTRPE